MLKEFKDFLLKTNALALAVGVIIGAAVGKVVSSIVSDLLMPIIGLVVPGGEWRQIKIALSHNPDGTPAAAVMLGSFLGNVVDFVIIGFVIFMIVKALLKPAPVPPAPPTKVCKECLETIPAEAKKCKFCCSPAV
jgi:large conductance mechanosensitive channel